MRLEHFEYLAAITRHGSIRKASEQLHMSQPALSEAIVKLEKDLGVTLLDRQRTGAQISRQGRELLPHFAAIADAVDQLRVAAGASRRQSRVLRVGTVSTATSSVLLPATRMFGRSHPDVTIEMVNLRTGEIDEAVAAGSLDMGLVNTLAGDDTPSGLTSTPLLSGHAVVVLRHDHALAQHESIDLADLRAESFVAMREGYLMNRLLRRLFGADLPPIRATTDGADLGKLMVAEGIGSTILPGYSVEGDPLLRNGTIVMRPLVEPTPRITLVLRERESGRSQAGAVLRDCLIRSAGDHAGDTA